MPEVTSFAAVPRASSWAVLRIGSSRARKAGMTRPNAWAAARRLAKTAHGTAWRFDKGGRIDRREEFA